MAIAAIQRTYITAMMPDRGRTPHLLPWTVSTHAIHYTPADSREGAAPRSLWSGPLPMEGVTCIDSAAGTLRS